jgi:hypothetical protein
MVAAEAGTEWCAGSGGPRGWLKWLKWRWSSREAIEGANGGLLRCVVCAVGGFGGIAGRWRGRRKGLLATVGCWNGRLGRILVRGSSVILDHLRMVLHAWPVHMSVGIIRRWGRRRSELVLGHSMRRWRSVRAISVVTLMLVLRLILVALLRVLRWWRLHTGLLHRHERRLRVVRVCWWTIG